MLIGLFCKAPTRLVWLWALQASCILISVSYCLLFAAQRHVLTYMEDAVSQLLENWAAYLKISPYLKKYVLVITRRYVGILK